MTGILFDLDGTLLNTLDDLMDAVNHTMEVFGYPRHSREEVRRFVGNGAGRLLQLSVPQGRDWQEPLAAFQSYYREHCQIKTAPYPGILYHLRKNGPQLLESHGTETNQIQIPHVEAVKKSLSHVRQAFLSG